MVRTIVRLTLLATAVGTVLAFKLLGWWAVVVVPAALLGAGAVAAKLFGGRLLEFALKAPFKAKGAVLRNADVEVHAVRPADEPMREAHREDPDDGTAASTPVTYFWLDATIRPAAGGAGPFQHWEPGELRLVTPGTDPAADDEGEPPCEIIQVRVEQDGKLAEDEGYKLPGPQRLQLGIGVKPGIHELQFQYYFETFGRVLLPAQ